MAATFHDLAIFAETLVAPLLEDGAVVLTAQKGADNRRNVELIADLEAVGASIYPVLGLYDDDGTVEQSFLCLGLSRQEAEELGRKYDQECVLVIGTGLVYTDGTGRIARQNGPISIGGDEELYYSLVFVGGEAVKFAVPVSFGEA